MGHINICILSILFLIALAVVSSMSFFSKDDLLMCHVVSSDGAIDDTSAQRSKIKKIYSSMGCTGYSMVSCLKTSNYTSFDFITCPVSFIASKDLSLCHYNSKDKKLSCYNDSVPATILSVKRSKKQG